MILTGHEIAAEVGCGRVVIDPYDPARVEPNSYGFHLGDELLCYDDEILDAHQAPTPRTIAIPEQGLELEPQRLYLGRTLETMGSAHYAATLYARRSASTAGIWIQYSAPLGHTGAIIPWTLEIRVAHPVIVYARMLIGKIAFWEPQGTESTYGGKYRGSTTIVPSRLAREAADPEPEAVG